MDDLPMQRILGLSLSPVDPEYAEWREENRTHECPICGDVHHRPPSKDETAKDDPTR